MAQISMVPVRYKGTGESVLAIVTGEVSLGFNDVMTNRPHMKSGHLRGLAVTSLQRSPAVPQLPTIAGVRLPRGEADETGAPAPGATAYRAA